MLFLLIFLLSIKIFREYSEFLEYSADFYYSSV